MKAARTPKAPLLELRATALEAAFAAGNVLLKHYGKKLKISEKKGAGIVTNADIEAERVAMRVLRRDFPEFKILTEESAPDPVASHGPARWVMDPLDGTTNFAHGFPMFCVSIAAEWHGEVVAGVIHHPVLRETCVAVKGKGAWIYSGAKSHRSLGTGKRMRVSNPARIEDALLSTGFTYKRDNWLKVEMHAFERLSGLARAVRRPGSAAMDLCYTARGVFDGFWERGLSPWDVAAGSLLITEAGGRVTDFAGNPFRVESREILAAGPKLHALLSQVIAPEFCAIEGR